MRKLLNFLNSNIFVNKQVNEEIREKIESALKKNTSNKYYFGKDFNISQDPKMDLSNIKMI